jgi:hypothetical protein
VTPVGARWDRHPVLHLHDGCRVCRWLVANWAVVHWLIGQLWALRPGRFAREIAVGEEVAA